MSGPQFNSPTADRPSTHKLKGGISLPIIVESHRPLLRDGFFSRVPPPFPLNTGRSVIPIRCPTVTARPNCAAKCILKLTQSRELIQQKEEITDGDLIFLGRCAVFFTLYFSVSYLFSLLFLLFQVFVFFSRLTNPT